MANRGVHLYTSELRTKQFSPEADFTKERGKGDKEVPWILSLNAPEQLYISREAADADTPSVISISISEWEKSVSF